MPLRSAVAFSLLLASAVPAHARPSSVPYLPRHHGAGAASELLAADDLNAMVLSILGGQPQPPAAPSGSEARRQRLQAAWARLRGLLLGER